MGGGGISERYTQEMTNMICRPIGILPEDHLTRIVLISHELSMWDSAKLF